MAHSAVLHRSMRLKPLEVDEEDEEFVDMEEAFLLSSFMLDESMEVSMALRSFVFRVCSSLADSSLLSMEAYRWL